MGKTATTERDMATGVAAKSLASVANSDVTLTAMMGEINFAVLGTFVATVRLEKSFDGGATFIPVCHSWTSTIATLTAPSSITVTEAEDGCVYRAACTAYTSGTIVTRISQGTRSR